ncbi:hypothetical protein CapIbe_011092 [Capra ibex]
MRDSTHPPKLVPFHFLENEKIQRSFTCSPRLEVTYGPTTPFSRPKINRGTSSFLKKKDCHALSEPIQM